MSDSPWLDHLARTASPVPGAAAPRPGMPEPAQVAGQGAAVPASQRPASPRLQQLLDERADLERRMSSLLQNNEPAPQDPRYQVASMAERRAELRAWAQRRDRARTHAMTRKNGAPGHPAPAPLESPYDQLDGRLRRAREHLQRRDMPARSPWSGGAGALDELLDQRLERALEKLRQKMDVADTPGLTAADAFLPRQWRRRGADLFTPGRPDPYVRDLQKKLGVEVGDLQELGQRYDRLRKQAQAARELAAAEREQDTQRRQRALDKLRARKQEEQAEDRRRAQKRGADEWPVEKRRRQREEAS